MKQVGWLIRDTSRSKSTRIFRPEGVALVYILLSQLSDQDCLPVFMLVLVFALSKTVGDLKEHCHGSSAVKKTSSAC